MAEKYEISVRDPDGQVVGKLDVEKAGTHVPAGPHQFQYKITGYNNNDVPLGTISSNRVNTFILWDGQKFMYPDPERSALNFNDALTLATQLVRTGDGRALEATNQFYLRRCSAGVTRL